MTNEEIVVADDNARWPSGIISEGRGNHFHGEPGRFPGSVGMPGDIRYVIPGEAWWYVGT